MKKLLAVCICLGLVTSITGCSPGNIVDRFISAGDPPAQESETPTARVYMDELTGSLQDFDGSSLTVITDEEETYVFDVSQATLECADGMITGDEISIIYEGQLTDTDTSSVTALKVVDEFHKKNHLEDRTAHGTVQSLTPNTITIQSKSGKTATYPITGTKQYYQNGIKKGTQVYLHFKGKFPESDSEDSTVLNASHLKVLSISDIDPLEVPDPTPTPAPSQEDSQEETHRLRATLQYVDMNTLTILPNNFDSSVTVDISSIPVYLKGGMAPGTQLRVIYTGELQEGTLSGITILGVTGLNPDRLDHSEITSTVSGTIIGTTANTVTMQTNDGAVVTCFTTDAQITSSQGLDIGWGISVTFHPSDSQESNIYTALKITDA